MNALQNLINLDIQCLEWIRTTFTLNTSWFPTVITLFADSEPLLFSLLLIGLWSYGTIKREKGIKHVTLDLFWHVLIAFGIYWIINQLLPMRPRPETVSSLPALISHLPDNSFPSGHAMYFGASWWALHKLTPWKHITWFFFVVGFLTVFTRVIAGIHYPLDILVGFFLGWGIMHILILLPHGKIYQKYAQDLPIKIMSSIGL
jgi:membrane-associated phospholipid phosphatase